MKYKLLALLCFLRVVLSMDAQINPKWIPELSTSTTSNFNYDGGKDITNFTLSSMDADWKNSGNGFSAQISYDVVAKHMMGLNVAWQFTPWFKVTLGEMKVKFLNEFSYSPRTLEVCGYSQGISYLGGCTRDICGLSTRARDWGVTFSGNIGQHDNFYRFNYTLGIFNGNGYKIKDDNSAKNFTALFLYNFTASFKASIGGMLGKYTVEDSETSSHLGDRNRLAGGLWYDDGRFFAKAEAVYGKTDRRESSGIFLLTGLWVRPDMAFAFRGDTFLMDNSSSDTRTTNADICFSHKLGQVFRYRVQYRHTFNTNPDTKDSNILSLSVSMKFSSRQMK